jgi:hypothetical protein
MSVVCTSEVCTAMLESLSIGILNEYGTGVSFLVATPHSYDLN